MVCALDGREVGVCVRGSQRQEQQYRCCANWAKLAASRCKPTAHAMLLCCCRYTGLLVRCRVQ